MADLREVEKRLEEATGPDRELDCVMFLHFNPLAKSPITETFAVGSDGPDNYILAPEYTRYIDDALALLPEGWEWFLGSGDPTCSAQCLTRPNIRLQPHMKNDVAWRVFGKSSVNGLTYAPTLPLAICLAAIRARSAGKE
ncbi:MAG: hypothetical protein KGL39_04710 [Patescibacteria group bacterium]|nr:hypothetical protein [Patescibacteria group bacterium]